MKKWIKSYIILILALLIMQMKLMTFSKLFQQLLNWSEVWACLIPASVLLFKRKIIEPLIPIAWYVIIALILNFCQDYIWRFSIQLPFTSSRGENTFIYNAHSIIRFILFSSFFIQLKQPFLTQIKKVVAIAFLLFALINFTFFQKFIDPNNFSSRLFSIEAALLFFYCLQYYLYKLQDDQSNYKVPDFWIVTGLSIYVAINFFIFLFYNELAKQSEESAIRLWNLHNISYIIFSIFIAKGIYAIKKQ